MKIVRMKVQTNQSADYLFTIGKTHLNQNTPHTHTHYTNAKPNTHPHPNRHIPHSPTLKN